MRAAMRDWQPTTTAPFDRDLQLSVIEKEAVYALIFPCRRTPTGWVNAETGKPISVDPTHWRIWLGG
jgi:hypothetical protein